VPDPTRYPVEVFYSDEDEGFIAIARDLPGCSAFGNTQAEAVSEIRAAIEAWQAAAREANNPIPEPTRRADDALPNGRILLRVPRSLHASLIECAKMEGVSLNQHLVSVLSFSVSTTLYRQTQKIIASTHFVQGSTVMVNAVRGPVSPPQFHFYGGVTALVTDVIRDVRSLPVGVPVIPERVR